MRPDRWIWENVKLGGMEMSGYPDGIGNTGIKIVVIAYLAVAFFVGVQKHRESGTPRYGTVGTIIEGAAWPITLPIDAVQRK